MGKKADQSWHAWRETRDRFLEDMCLRSWGWEIRSRPARGPAMWWLRGSVPEIVLTHADALETVKLWAQEGAAR